MYSVELPGIRVVEIVSEPSGHLLFDNSQASSNFLVRRELTGRVSWRKLVLPFWAAGCFCQQHFAKLSQTAQNHPHTDILPAAFKMERAQPHRRLHSFCARPGNDGGQPSPTCVFFLFFFSTIESSVFCAHHLKSFQFLGHFVSYSDHTAKYSFCFAFLQSCTTSTQSHRNLWNIWECRAARP